MEFFLNKAAYFTRHFSNPKNFSTLQVTSSESYLICSFLEICQASSFFLQHALTLDMDEDLNKDPEMSKFANGIHKDMNAKICEEAHENAYVKGLLNEGIPKNIIGMEEIDDFVDDEKYSEEVDGIIEQLKSKILQNIYEDRDITCLPEEKGPMEIGITEKESIIAANDPTSLPKDENKIWKAAISQTNSCEGKRVNAKSNLRKQRQIRSEKTKHVRWSLEDIKYTTFLKDNQEDDENYNHENVGDDNDDEDDDESLSSEISLDSDLSEQRLVSTEFLNDSKNEPLELIQSETENTFQQIKQDENSLLFKSNKDEEKNNYLVLNRKEISTQTLFTSREETPDYKECKISSLLYQDPLKLVQVSFFPIHSEDKLLIVERKHSDISIPEDLTQRGSLIKSEESANPEVNDEIDVEDEEKRKEFFERLNDKLNIIKAELDNVDESLGQISKIEESFEDFLDHSLIESEFTKRDCTPKQQEEEENRENERNKTCESFIPLEKIKIIDMCKVEEFEIKPIPVEDVQHIFKEMPLENNEKLLSDLEKETSQNLVPTENVKFIDSNTDYQFQKIQKNEDIVENEAKDLLLENKANVLSKNLEKVTSEHLVGIEKVKSLTLEQRENKPCENLEKKTCQNSVSTENIKVIDSCVVEKFQSNEIIEENVENEFKDSPLGHVECILEKELKNEPNVNLTPMEDITFIDPGINLEFQTKTVCNESASSGLQESEEKYSNVYDNTQKKSEKVDDSEKTKIINSHMAEEFNANILIGEKANIHLEEHPLEEKVKIIESRAEQEISSIQVLSEKTTFEFKPKTVEDRKRLLKCNIVSKSLNSNNQNNLTKSFAEDNVSGFSNNKILLDKKHSGQSHYEILKPKEEKIKSLDISYQYDKEENKSEEGKVLLHDSKKKKDCNKGESTNFLSQKRIELLGKDENVEESSNLRSPIVNKAKINNYEGIVVGQIKMEKTIQGEDLRKSWKKDETKSRQISEPSVLKVGIDNETKNVFGKTKSISIFRPTFLQKKLQPEKMEVPEWANKFRKK